MACRCKVCGIVMEEGFPTLIVVHNDKNVILCSAMCLKQLLYEDKKELLIINKT